MTFLKKGQDLENQTAHPHQEFPREPPFPREKSSDFVIKLGNMDMKLHGEILKVGRYNLLLLSVGAGLHLWVCQGFGGLE